MRWEGKFVLRGPRQILLFACSPFAMTVLHLCGGVAKDWVPAAPPGSGTRFLLASSFSPSGSKDWDKRQLDLDRKRPWVITLCCRQEPPLPGEGKREGRTLSLSSVQSPFIWEELMDRGIAL